MFSFSVLKRGRGFVRDTVQRKLYSTVVVVHDRLFSDPKTRLELGEGIPLRDYSYAQLLLALPVGICLEFLFFLQRCFSVDQTRPDEFSIPQGAIIVTFHGDSYLDPLSTKAWKYFAEANYRWLGFHGFLSYIGTFRAMWMGIKAFRYDRKRKTRPMDQVRSCLNQDSDSLFMLRTDAGGPYGKVRPSLIRMAIEFKRPLVCMRVSASRKLRINHHCVALPGAKIRTKLSDAISVKELEEASKGGVEGACRLVELRMRETLEVCGDVD